MIPVLPKNINIFREKSKNHQNSMPAAIAHDI